MSSSSTDDGKADIPDAGGEEGLNEESESSVADGTGDNDGFKVTNVGVLTTCSDGVEDESGDEEVADGSADAKLSSDDAKTCEEEDGTADTGGTDAIDGHDDNNDGSVDDGLFVPTDDSKEATFDGVGLPVDGADDGTPLRQWGFHPNPYIFLPLK